jgi:hypothetical protein
MILGGGSGPVEDADPKQIEIGASEHLAFDNLKSYVESGRGGDHVSSVLTTELGRWLERHGGAGGEVAGAGPACAGGRVAADLGDLGRAARTIDAYARGLAEYLEVCEREGVDPVTANRAHIGVFVRALTERPSRRGANVVTLDSGSGLSNATIQQRIVVTSG